MKKLFLILSILTIISILLFCFVSVYTLRYMGRIQKNLNYYKEEIQKNEAYASSYNINIKYLKEDMARSIAFLLYSLSTAAICPVIYCISYYKQFSSQIALFKQRKREARKEKKIAKLKEKLNDMEQ